jgi:hypothetical protein
MRQGTLVQEERKAEFKMYLLHIYVCVCVCVYSC